MAKDKIHYIVRKALEKDDWEIVADPYRFQLETRYVEIDLEAEKIVVAERGKVRILVEIKTIGKTSLLYQFYGAFGQYVFYRHKLEDYNINEPIFLAISSEVFEEVQNTPELLNWLNSYKINLLIVNLESATIEQWIKHT